MALLTSRDTGPRSSGVDCAWQEPREVMDLDIDPERSWIRLLDKDGLITQPSSLDGHGIGYGLWTLDLETIQNTPSYHKACFGGQMLSRFLVKAGISNKSTRKDGYQDWSTIGNRAAMDNVKI